MHRRVGLLSQRLGHRFVTEPVVVTSRVSRLDFLDGLASRLSADGKLYERKRAMKKRTVSDMEAMLRTMRTRSSARWLASMETSAMTPLIQTESSEILPTEFSEVQVDPNDFYAFVRSGREAESSALSVALDERAQMSALLSRMRAVKMADQRWKEYVLRHVRPSTFMDRIPKHLRSGAASLWREGVPYWDQLDLIDLDGLNSTELKHLLNNELEGLAAAAPSELQSSRMGIINTALLRAPSVHYDIPAGASSAGFERLKFLRKLYDIRLRQESEHDAYLCQRELLKAVSGERKSFREPILLISCVKNNVFVSAHLDGRQVFGTTGGYHVNKKLKKTLDIAAAAAVKQVLAVCRLKGITKAHVHLRGSGKARQGALTALSRLRKSFEVLSVRDVTSLPHGGGRRKRKRYV